MRSLSYNDLRLAKVYDTLNPPTPDLDFYEHIIGSEPRTILDVGSGTGRFACRLAAIGHKVTGAEPATGMLSVARTRPGSHLVRWIQSTASEVNVQEKFDFITMTGHVFQVLTGDDDILSALINLRRHLKPDGRLAFETRNPLVREWIQWIPDLTRETIYVEGEGVVKAHNDIALVSGDLVTYETHYLFEDGSKYVAPDTLRFVTQDQLAAFLSLAGFTCVQWYGDWDQRECTPSSREIIAIASP